MFQPPSLLESLTFGRGKEGTPDTRGMRFILVEIFELREENILGVSILAPGRRSKAEALKSDFWARDILLFPRQ